MERRHIPCVLVASLLFASSLFAQAPTLRFAWLSDTHVGSSTGADDLRAAVRDINATADVQFVILSGDVTEFGSNEQLLEARALLDSLRTPYYIIPGNHDTKWSESGATMFLRLWGNDRFVFDAGGFRFIGLHEGPRMRMGDGHWAPEDLRWLDSVLTALPSRDQPVIFVTHYPLDPGIDNWYEVVDRLKRVNTEAVLVGHGHADRRENFEGIPAVMGRSLLRARDNAGGYNIVSVKGDTATFMDRITGLMTHAPWDTVILRAHPFAQDTTRYPRPDFSVNARFPGVRTLWSFSTGYTIGSTPAVSGNLVILGDASGTVHALRMDDGSPVWKFPTGGPVYATPAALHGLVVFGSADGSVYCLHARTGLLQWSSRVTGPVLGCPVIRDTVVYVGASDSSFRAFGLLSGRELWKFNGLHGFVETRPLLDRNRVIFGAWDEHLYALDAHDGHLLWTWAGGRPGTLYSPAACWPVGSHGRVFIVAPDRFMTALDAGTGSEVWRTAEHQVRESIGISEDGERVYVRTMQDSILALSASAGSPTVLWTENLHFGYDINSAMLVEKEGVLFYATKNGLIIALEGKTGGPLWEHRVSEGLVNTLLPLSSRRVIATDTDGRVQLVESVE